MTNAEMMEILRRDGTVTLRWHKLKKPVPDDLVLLEAAPDHHEAHGYRMGVVMEAMND